jgi:hypothetical protein
MSQAALAERSKVTIRVTGHRATISAPREHLYDLKKFQRLQEVVLGKLGHVACVSGFDLRWRQFEEIVQPG